nr:receptor-like cytosolic serine/threonine-protein kinase RBK2 [Ipomoea batatas]
MGERRLSRGNLEVWKGESASLQSRIDKARKREGELRNPNRLQYEELAKCIAELKKCSALKWQQLSKGPREVVQTRMGMPLICLDKGNLQVAFLPCAHQTLNKTSCFELQEFQYFNNLVSYLNGLDLDKSNLQIEDSKWYYGSFTRTICDSVSKSPIMEGGLSYFKPQWKNFSLSEIEIAPNFHHGEHLWTIQHVPAENLIGKGGYAEVHTKALARWKISLQLAFELEEAPRGEDWGIFLSELCINGSISDLPNTTKIDLAMEFLKACWIAERKLTKVKPLLSLLKVDENVSLALGFPNHGHFVIGIPGNMRESFGLVRRRKAFEARVEKKGARTANNISNITLASVRTKSARSRQKATAEIRSPSSVPR